MLSRWKNDTVSNQERKGCDLVPLLCISSEEEHNLVGLLGYIS